MGRPAIFFDRDNTLLACDGYLGDPAGVALVSGAADAVARARELGYATVVVSNQSGVARGMFDEDAVAAVNRRFDEMLLESNPAAVIDRHEYCPFHPDATVEKYKQDSELRKPKPGMLLKAARDLDIDLSRSWLIGDAPRDIEAGRAAGCRTILFQDSNLPASPATNASSEISPDFKAASLKDALDIVEQQQDPHHETSNPKPEISNLKSQISNFKSEISNPKPDPLLRVAEQILVELRRQNEHNPTAIDFSVSKLLAGIVQILVLAVLFFAYINRSGSAPTILLVAVTLQAMTIALLIMGRQR